MNGPFTHITQSMELDDRDVATAIDARDTTRALLIRLATVAAPESGAAKVLLVFARMGTTACQWMEGDLCVELVSDDQMTVIEVWTELGGGLRERIFPPLPFRAPLAEFTHAIQSAPAIVAPLTIRANSERRITLVASDAVRGTTVPPPPLEITRDTLIPPHEAGASQQVESNRGSALGLAGRAQSLEPGPAGHHHEVLVTAETVPGDVDSGWDE